MKSNLRARGTRVSLKPSFVPATEAAQTRSSAQPRAPAVMTHVVSCRVARAPPPQVQMEEPSCIDETERGEAAEHELSLRSTRNSSSLQQQRPHETRR